MTPGTSAPPRLAGPFAQTNVALAIQLQSLGYGEADRLAVRRAYAIAMPLFAGHFRPNGNTFLAHLVRTASILAVLDAPSPVVVAGLLHAAYTHGEFGDGRRRAPTPAKRAEVRAAIGGESERIVHRYVELPWRDVVTARSASALPAEDRVVMLVRLANELDEGLEATGPDVAAPRAHSVARTLLACAETAGDLGHADLATALHDVGAALARPRLDDGAPATEWTWPTGTGAVYYDGPRGCFLLAPRSHRLRPSVALRYRARASSVVRTLYATARSLLARSPRAS